WDAMRAVPAGTTISYAELAARAGQPTAPRAAGAACAANLIAPVIPCHRIVGRDGSLHGYYYGLPCKERLLAHQAAHTPYRPPRAPPPPPCRADGRSSPRLRLFPVARGRRSLPGHALDSSRREVAFRA